MNKEQRRWIMCKALMKSQLIEVEPGVCLVPHPTLVWESVNSAFDSLGERATDKEIVDVAFLKLLAKRLRCAEKQIHELMDKLPDGTPLTSMGLVSVRHTPEDIERCLAEIDPQMSQPWLQGPLPS